MSATVIQVEQVGKKFSLRHRQVRPPGLRHVLQNTLDRVFTPLRRLPVALPGTPSPASESEDFWALKDVSFSIARGEIVGIIGRNGAGKSTLLKVLSRIIEPTEGRITLEGRVASLLEVGTGFHPELTGRENIFLNGAILGMSRLEIKSKFDEIVAFAEVSRFVDTPVKYYSSGMYVRLAFSVAAHLEPEILIVDEVLAVGDAEFQRKCLGKMEDVSHSGRTILFVSHNMAVVSQLCTRSIVLKAGQVSFEGRTATAISRYVESAVSQSSRHDVAESDHLASQDGASKIALRYVELVEPEFSSFTVRWCQPIKLRLAFEVKALVREFVLALSMNNSLGVDVFSSHHTDAGHPFSLSPGWYAITVTMENPLRAGIYRLAIGAAEIFGNVGLFHVDHAAHIEVLDVGAGDKVHPQYGMSIIHVPVVWSDPIPIPVDPLHERDLQHTVS